MSSTTTLEGVAEPGDSLGHTEDNTREASPLLHSSEMLCAERYAKISHIGPWVPETDPEDKRANTFSVKLARRSTMLLIQAGLALTITIAAVAVIVWALSTYSVFGDRGTFFIGSCSMVDNWNLAVHTGLNVLSTLFLGAGNYSMQVLVAPSRSEADKAHRQGRSVDIGIHSFRNLHRIRAIRRIIWTLLGAVATTLHFLWNSAIFASIPFVVLPAAIVTRDFATSPDDWAVTNPITDPTIAENSSIIYALHEEATNFSSMSNLECIKEYLSPTQATRALVLVSSVLSQDNLINQTESSLLHGWISGSDDARWNGATQWICGDREPPLWGKACTLDWARTFATNWTVNEYPIEHCLVGKAGDNSVRCGLHFSRSIGLVVTVCMAIDFILLLAVARIGRSPTFITLGDALASYLEIPRDPNTEPRSHDLNKARHFSHLQSAVWSTPRRRPFIFSAVSAKSWIATMVLILAALALGFTLFATSITALRGQGLETDLPALARYGFGRAQAFELIGGLLVKSTGTARGFLQHVLFVNMFQIMLSFLYLFYNNCLTCQAVASSWANYMLSGKDSKPLRKPLRVSSHTGLQRSTYFLSLPWTTAVPLLVAFAALHTLVSRSCFIVQTTAFSAGPNEQASRLYQADASRVGYSSLAILVSTIFGCVVFVALLANSLRRFAPSMPAYQARLATNSAFISAACRRPAGDFDAHQFSVTYAVVEADPGGHDDGSGGYPRLVFTSDRLASAPVHDTVYVQALPVDEWDDWVGLVTALRKSAADGSAKLKGVAKMTGRGFIILGLTLRRLCLSRQGKRLS